MVGELFSVGGPIVAIATIIVLFLRLYFDRKDSKKKPEADNGIIETVRMTLEIARTEMANVDLRYRECEAKTDKLKQENDKLQEQLRWIERSV